MRGRRWRLCSAVAALLLLNAPPTAAANCLNRTVLTTDCKSVCPKATVCVKYSSRASALVDRTTFTAELNTDRNSCVFHCLQSSVDPLRQILNVQLPAVVEDIAALSLPANTTGLELTSDALTTQTVSFPDKNIVANGTLLNYLGLQNILPESLPALAYDLPLATLRLQLKASVFPGTISRFKTINTLILDGSDLNTFPYAEIIDDMPQVRTLSLTANTLSQLRVDETTRSLYAASALLQLALGENKLTEFGAGFTSLRVLDLHGNQLRALPTALASMPVLNQLRLDGNPLDSTLLTAQLSSMQPLSEMHSLNLSSCGLSTTIPAGFSAVFVNLTDLDLSHNSVESIVPGHLPEASLTALNVSANKLTHFAGSFTNLQRLDISHNQFDTLPTVFPSSLISLNASSNTISTINISGLSNLEVLDLSHNNLSTFPAALVWNSIRLTVLRLHGNANMMPINLTTDQFNKLQELTELSVDDATFNSTACHVSWLKTKHGVSVCVEPSTTDQPEQTSKTVMVPSSSNSRSAGIITTVVLAIGGITFGITAYLQSRKRQRRLLQQALDNFSRTRQDSDAVVLGDTPTASKGPTGRANPLSTMSTSASIWNDDQLLQLRLDMNIIRFFKVVGMGAYGQVWRGTCRTSSTESCHVAIKTLTPDLARHRTVIERFLAQVRLQSTLHHPRIVTVIGIAWNSPTDVCALMEFMPRGDLFATLHYSSSSSCSSTSTLFQPGVWGESKLQIALDIIEALSYLHSRTPVVLHRDLKSRNVLLDTHGRAKLSDVTVLLTSRDESAVTSPLWTAPEVLAGKHIYDEKADIFSFGVILSELDTHEIPYGYDGSATTMLTSATKLKHGRNAPRDQAQQRQLLREIALGEIHPKFLPSCPSAIYNIAQQCLAPDRMKRPSALDINFLLRRVERDGSDLRISTVV